jgi:hypothetical protein
VQDTQWAVKPRFTIPGVIRCGPGALSMGCEVRIRERPPALGRAGVASSSVFPGAQYAVVCSCARGP